MYKSVIALLLYLFVANSSPAHNFEQVGSNNAYYQLDENNYDLFCRPRTSALGELVSTVSKGVVDVSSTLFETAKRVAPHIKDGIGNVAHYAHSTLDSVDPEALARIAKAAADVAVVSAPVLGSLLGIEIPASALESISAYATPDNAKLALTIAKSLTGATEAIFYTDPTKEKQLTTVETAGEVVKNAADTVKGLSEYLLANEGKISKDEENQIKKAIQDGIKILEQER
ncbi:MAG: hypothetical protein KC505_09730 [Myxococcales bacterium]|nr:hypothetical protein [Myxococcales bacterium]USN51069.1 MAG: hypothetical protein H6731_01270 [Myxococcales bacterium]